MPKPTPLTFSLPEFPEGVSERVCVLDPGELDLAGSEAEIRGTIQLVLEFTRARDELRVRGEAQLRVRQPCSACLTETETDVRAAVGVLVRATHAREREREGEDTPDGIVLLENDSFALDDEVRQVILLEIPTRPLCRADCRGLCPRCGVNLNEDSCDCHTHSAGDPRWGSLRDLLREGGGDDGA